MRKTAPQRGVASKSKKRKIYFELKRKSVHILVGVLIVFLISRNWFFLPFWFFVCLVILAFSYFLKGGGKIPKFHKFIISFERKEEKKKFPLKGALLFWVGCVLPYIIFGSQIAIAAIITLVVGDSVAAIYGISFGKIKSPTISQKHLDSAFVAVVANTLFLSFFLNFSFGIVLLASFVTFLLESIIPFGKTGKGVFGFFIDDNILIPLIFGLVLFFIA